MQPPLSPATMLATAGVFPAGKTPTWFRLRRTDDGILCLESISDDRIRSTDPTWAFCADVPPQIARQLGDDDSPDKVSGVLARAMAALGYV